jgi:hypothetical protein
MIRLTLTIILLLVIKGQHNQYYTIPTRILKYTLTLQETKKASHF